MSAPEVTCLIIGTRYYLGTTTADEVIGLLDSKINWDLLIPLAIEHSVLPLLYHSLQSSAANRVPEPVMVKLQNYYHMNALHNLARTRELLKLLDELERHGIAAVPYKGPVLATAAYGEINLRQFKDLDLLVQLQDFWQAKAVLSTQGYRFVFSKITERYSFKQDLQVCLKRSGKGSIDLHWGIPPRRVLRTSRFNLLWQNLSTIEVLGRSIKVFSAEVMLVVQCINVAKDPQTLSFKQICDVAQIVQAHPKLNWSVCLDVSAQLRTQRLFLLGLSFAHQLMQVPLPKLILERMAQVLPDQPSLDEICSQIFQEESGSNTELQDVRSNYARYLSHLDRRSDAVFVTIHYWLRVLEQILLPNEMDRELLPLPSWLFFVYYLYHPMRVLLKLLRLLFLR